MSNKCAGDGCKCPNIHHGKCITCGKTHELEIASGLKVVVDTRREWQGWIFPPCSTGKHDLKPGETCFCPIRGLR